MHSSNVWQPRFWVLGLCGVVLAMAAGTSASAAARWQADDPHMPAPVRALATAVVFDRFNHLQPRPMLLKFADVSVQVEVAERQPCPARGILMEDEAPPPEQGQLCTVATLVEQAPNHPEFRQVIASLVRGDNGALTTLHLALYQLEPGGALPQLLLSGYTGGAHCCAVSALVGADGTGQWHVSELPSQDGDSVPGVVDINHDGGRQFVFSDQRFNYRFAPYVWSVMPLVIYEYAQGQIKTVTTQPAYRPFLTAYFRHDFASGAITSFAQGEVNGFLAAYVANSANLGQLQAGWNYMLRRYNRSMEQMDMTWCALDKSVWGQGVTACPAPYVHLVPYPQQLALFLLQSGYITHAQCVALGYDPEKIQQEQDAIRAADTARWHATHPG